jgi:superfamily II DNA or RNA helicase
MEIFTLNKMIEAKNIEQKKALNTWAKTGFKGSVIAGTGFGKSRVGVIAVGETLRKDDTRIGIVLVPTTQLQDQFVNEFLKWGYDDIIDRVDILCYQTAYKLQDQHYNVVICDEIHLGLSPKYRRFLENNSYDRLLCMTATLPEEPEYKLLLHKIAPTIYKITLDECVKLGLVAPYEVYCVPLEMTETEQADYKKINNSFVYWKYQLGQFDAFKEAQRIMSDKNATGADKQAASQFYRAIRERKKIVDFAANKISVTKQVVVKNISHKILIFTGANDFTDTICSAIQPLALAYHSKIGKKARAAAIEKFKSGEVNVLCSTKALNQGLDVPDADIGIICGITSKSLSMIQRVGRLLRFQENKVGKIIILYVKDSQEEKWLKNAVKTLDNIKWMSGISDL